eukprot:220839-Prorocentrum_minimum.AAC.3
MHCGKSFGETGNAATDRFKTPTSDTRPQEKNGALLRSSTDIASRVGDGRQVTFRFVLRGRGGSRSPKGHNEELERCAHVYSVYKRLAWFACAPALAAGGHSLDGTARVRSPGTATGGSP